MNELSTFYPRTAEMPRRGDLQHVTRTPDTLGNRTDSFTTYASVWFGLPSNSGREKEAQKAITEAVTFNITIRYRTDVVRNDRLLYGSRAFLINDVDDPGEAHAVLKLICTEIVDA